MQRTPVSSSNIASIGYDPASEVLEIEFVNGAVYQYFEVPGVIYDALMSAPSHGVFLNANVKNHFRFERL